MEQLLNEVAQAIHVLNHDPQSTNRLAANQWILQFQQTDAAWEIAASVLTSDLRHQFISDYEVQFFAAQILKQKIHKEGFGLQSGAKDALLNALLLAAKRFSSGPPQLLTQVCLALSNLALHGKPIEKLLYSLQNLQSQENGNSAALELLTVFPEIIEDRKGDGNWRYEYGQELLACTPMVLDFLVQQSKEGFGSRVLGLDSNRKILRCLLSWVRAGCFSEIPPSSLSAHPLFNFVFGSLQDTSSFDLAVDVLVELVSRYEGLPEVLLHRIGFLKEVLLLTGLQSRDERLIGRLACLMSEIGQAAPFLIVKASTEALALADALLSCVAFSSQDWEIADSTLQFWCILANCISELNVHRAENRRNVEECFIPVFSTLVDALLLRAQVDDSTYNDYGRTFDMPSGLEQFRMNLVELLVELCQLLGSASFIGKIFSGNSIYSSMHVSWKEVEAKLFVLNAVSDVVIHEEQHFDSSIITQLVTILSNETSDNLKGFMCLIYKSLADVIGSYAKWLKTSQTDVRLFTLFLATGISQPICSSACAHALRKFCEEASTLMHEPSNLKILICIAEGMEEKHLASEDEEEIVNAITLIFCLSPEKNLVNNLISMMISPLHKIVGKLIDENHRLVLRKNPSMHTEIISSLRRGLYRIGTLFNYLGTYLSTGFGPDESLHSLVEVFWPLLEQLFSSELIESLSLSTAACRALALAIQASGQHFVKLLPKVLNCLSTNFMAFQSHECYIRTASVLIEEFGSMEEYGQLYISTFERFTRSSSLMALSSSYICDQEPDLFEAYTNFASSFVRSCLKEVLAASSFLFEVSLQKAGICCTAMHRGAALSAMSYISCFLDLGRLLFLEPVGASERSVQDMLLRVVSLNGESLVSNLMYALLGVSAMSRVHRSATILQQLAAVCILSERTKWKSVLCWEFFHRWLYSALQTLPADYLKPGEVESLIPVWLKSLDAAASDYLESRGGGDLSSHRHMQGKGGRALKRLIREFADNHRHIPALT